MEPMSTDERLLTADDVLAPQYERGELWDGVFVVREPSGGWSGAVGFRVAGAIAGVLHDAEGWAFDAGQGYTVAREPDRVLAPDVSFVSRARLKVPPTVGFIEGPPDFAVEVRSPSDGWTATIEKGGIWIGHGARVVWCIDPRARLVVVMRPGRAPLEIGPGATATARPVLPLDLEVDSLFAGLE